MTNYLKNAFQPMGATPQNQPIPGTNQVPNSAGGYAWALSHWQRFSRFLVLGAEGGTYYISEKALTIENANAVLACIAEDGVRVVQEIVAISQAGRAPKNDPAIFALALVAAKGNDAARKAALDALPEVCRTGTHLFQFATYVQAFRGWGRGLRRAVGAWYQALEPRKLAYQVVKYRQRENWTHTDTLRLAHPKPVTDAHGAIYKWITNREETEWAKDFAPPADEALAFIWAFERVQTAADVETVVKLIETYDLPREALPTQWLNDPAVWEALLVKMPLTAMIRNLGVMSKIGLLTPLSDVEQTVVERLGDTNRLRKARVHPIAVLSALRVYGMGRGFRGDGTWKPTARITDALDAAFYEAFHNVEPANKRIMLALDVSGSMGAGAIAGVPGLTPRDGSAAMALVTAKTERQHAIVSFQDKIVPLNISTKMRLDDVTKATNGLPFGRTDCAQPMIYALDNKIKVDTFVIYTDNETYAGTPHPAQALVKYRDKLGIDAKLVVVGMTSNNFTIAGPKDPAMLDVVGFDSAAPAVISDFARGVI